MALTLIVPKMLVMRMGMECQFLKGCAKYTRVQFELRNNGGDRDILSNVIAKGDIYRKCRLLRKVI